MNITALIDGAKAVGSHPITKGGALASLISGGLYAAVLAGVAIPTWALSAGPIAGYILYKILPTKEEQEIDKVAQEVVDIAGEVPQTYQEYPTGVNGASAAQESPAGRTVSNINQG